MMLYEMLYSFGRGLIPSDADRLVCFRYLKSSSTSILFQQAIVKNILSQYNKRLDSDQMNELVTKDGSSNPLWLTLACEELRVFGDFQQLLGKIESLPDDLIR